MKRCLTRAAVVAFLLLTSMSPGRGERSPVTSVMIEDVAHLHQSAAFSGEACAAMFLSRAGRRVRPEDVFNQAEVDPLLGRGCGPRELRDSLRRLGVEPGHGVFPVGAVAPADDVSPAGDRESAVAERQWELLRRDLARGVASIVALGGEGDSAGSGLPFRFLLVVGHDVERDEVVYHDPARRDGAGLRMPRAHWLRRWPRHVPSSGEAIVRIALHHSRPVNVERTDGFTPADYAGHVARLRRRLPSDDFHITLSEPFVVVGDLDLGNLEKRATGTVRWAVERLKGDYFSEDPQHILDVWLFRDADSYERHATQLFGERPGTPYGYYSRRHRALVMNIATGGGTLVHEIVHPFMEANFPACPAWFNEGLASLYEQSAERDGRIVGLTNWRLRGLQQAIGRQRVPPFRTLCETSSHEFYREDSGTNYAQARYLCYYLQERKLLRKYYREFRRGAADDPSGYETLVRILGEPDMRDFQKQWEEFVLELRF